MPKYEYEPKGVCSKKIKFKLDSDNKLSELEVVGGCQGNLKALSIVLEGMSAGKIISLLEGNKCGNKPSSCMDQLTKALKLALKNKQN